MYAGGQPTDDPDIALYDVCTTYGVLPSQIEDQDPMVMERLAYINYVVKQKLNAEANKSA